MPKYEPKSTTHVDWDRMQNLRFRNTLALTGEHIKSNDFLN